MKQRIFILMILCLTLISSVNAAPAPDPTSLSSDLSTSGHVKWSWSAGSGNVTDSYNVSVNDIWYNTTTASYYDHNIGVGETSTIIIYAYNNTDGISAGNVTGSAVARGMMTGITDVIDAVIPIFDSFVNLMLAIVPLTMFIIILTGIIIMMKKVFDNLEP